MENPLPPIPEALVFLNAITNKIEYTEEGKEYMRLIEGLEIKVVEDYHVLMTTLKPKL